MGVPGATDADGGGGNVTSTSSSANLTANAMPSYPIGKIIPDRDRWLIL